MDAKLDELGMLALMFVLLAIVSTILRGQPAERLARFAPPSEAAADAFTRELAAIARGVWFREYAREARDAS